MAWLVLNAATNAMGIETTAWRHGECEATASIMRNRPTICIVLTAGVIAEAEILKQEALAHSLPMNKLHSLTKTLQALAPKIEPGQGQKQPLI